jgi:hypothetical protein
MKKFLIALSLVLSGAAFASTTVPLQQAPKGYSQAVVCRAVHFDGTNEVIPSGTCVFTAKAVGSGRGGGYVKGARTWFTATWDLFGNLTQGAKCATQARYTSVAPPIVYVAGYDYSTCNADLIDNEVPYILNGYAYYDYIGPSLAGEFVLNGNLLILP